MDLSEKRNTIFSIFPVILIGLLLAGFFYMACNGVEKKEADSASYLSTDTIPKEAPYQQPAFPNQTRAPQVTSKTAIRVDFVTRELVYPWGMEFLPDHRMIVTEKPGRIRIMTLDGEIGDSILGVPPVHFERDGGLMDIALDPDFANNRMVYWAYSEPIDTQYTPSIAKGRLSEDEKRLEEVRVIYRINQTNHLAFHYGARLLFDDEGYLLACFGERMLPELRDNAQNLQSALGKVIRIQRDGSPARGNPYAGQEGAFPELWAIGLRDPQGLAFHPETGDLWLSDHGPLAGDEINLIEAGKNYGWPVITYGTEYNREPVNEGITQKEGMEQPIYYWDPAISPSGITFYDGDLIPEWRNNLFVTALKGMHVARLIIRDNRVVGEERLLSDLKMRFRDVVNGPDGALYILTDTEEGCIIRLSPVD